VNAPFSGDREKAAAEALARFQAKWPAERCKALGAFYVGTPAERDAALFRIAERAMDREDLTPAEAAMRSMCRGLA
jgi:hypothetical protein